MYFILGYYIVGSRENGNVLQYRMYLSCQWVCLGNPVNFIPEKFYPD